MKLRFPSKATAGTSAACSTTYQSTDDCEQYTYDANGNITDLRKRDGTEIDNTYDDLNRITLRDAPGTTNDVTYVYDNNGLRTSESVPSHTMSYEYDAQGRLVEKEYNSGSPISYEYDAASRLTELTHPDGFEVDYTWDTAGNPKTAVVGSTTLATVTYDDLQRRTSVDYGNGADSSYAYDAASRLTDLDWDVNGTADDITYDLTYNPAWQVITLAATPSAMNWAAPANNTDSYTVNGLNQYTAIAGQTITHDKRGNITTDHRGRTYTYDIDNRLLTIASLPNGTATYAYYPEGNLRQKSYNSTVSKFYYDDTQEIYETDGSNNKLRRYIRLPGSTDEPFLMIDYTLDGSCTNTSFANCEIWAHQDQRNSVVTTTDDNGDVVDVYTYASFGSSGTEGDAGFPFRFTGQKLDADAGLYYYKARWYDPATGRFMQTDPIWYEDFTNLYLYVGNDPVNYYDPTGKQSVRGCVHCNTPISITRRTKPVDGPVAQRGNGYSDGRFSLSGEFRTGRDGQPRAHKGVDLVAPTGTEIKAADDGKVVVAEGGYAHAGNQVAIEHSDGTTTQNFHMDSIGVEEGNKVENGQTIGTVGTTGNSSDNTPHLHFEVRQGADLQNGVRGQAIDPDDWLSETTVEIGTDPDLP